MSVEKTINLEIWMQEKRKPKRKQTQHTNLLKLELLRNFERINSEGKEILAEYSDTLAQSGRFKR